MIDLRYFFENLLPLVMRISLKASLEEELLNIADTLTSEGNEYKIKNKLELQTFIREPCVELLGYASQ